MRLGTVTAVVGALLLAAAGCASTAHRLSPVDDAGSAVPGPDLVGSWRGTAFAVGGSAYLISTPVELAITPDGTWAWKARGATRATGTLARQRGRVVLHASASTGAGAPADDIQLQQRGDHLWGVSRYFIPGASSAVDLRRQGGPS